MTRFRHFFGITPFSLGVIACLIGCTLNADGLLGNHDPNGGNGGNSHKDADHENSNGGTGGDPGDSGDVDESGKFGDSKLLAITVTSPTSLLQLPLNMPSTLTFQATGKFVDGGSGDISEIVTWSHSNSELSAYFSDPTLNFAPIDKTGAWTTTVTASYKGISGSTQLTVVAYRQSGPQQDFFFILPYQDPKGVQDDLLEFKTDVPALDVFFNMDTTGSMSGAITNLRNSLKTQIVPAIKAQIPNTQFGVGEFMDFPITPYGSTGDQPFRLLLPITSDVDGALTAMNKYSATGGGDTPGTMIESLYQIATGEGLTGPGSTNVPPNNYGIGGVGFRAGTMRVIVTVTDAASHTVNEDSLCSSQTNYAGAVAAVAHSREQALNSLNLICTRSVGVAGSTTISGCDSPYPDLVNFANETGARVPPQAWGGACGEGMCCTGLNGAARAADGDKLCPLVFITNSNGTGMGSHVVTGLQMLTQYAPFDVITDKTGNTTSTTGDPLPTGKTTANFVRAVVPQSFTKPTSPPGLTDPTMTTTTFRNVTPGTTVRFSVSAYNDFVQPLPNKAQIFQATIKVMASGCTDLDQRQVLILVPPAE